jgi:hypothetical protein
MSRPAVALALVHHPVVDRRGDLVTTAVTNLDIHDIARTACTYGVRRFYLVTPLAEQRTLVERILHHWRQGYGASYNPHRAEALDLVRTVGSIEDALEDWKGLSGSAPVPILTSAGRGDGISFRRCTALLEKKALLLVFGTGWGLAPEVFERGWAVLEPVKGAGDYNHLPVRAAAAIILDRLLGRPVS